MSDVLLWLLPFIVISIVIGVLSGTVGTYIYIHNMSSISSGLAHFMFGPIGVAYVLSILLPFKVDPYFFSAIISVGIMCILPLDSHGKIKFNHEVQVLLSFGMALGILILFLLPSPINFDTFLFGSIFTIDRVGIIFICISTLLSIIVEILFHTRFKYLGLDDDFLIVRGIRVQLFYRLQLVVIALGVVVLLHSVGMLLLIAILTIPPAIVSLFTSKYEMMIHLSIVVSISILVLGIFMSYWFNVPLSAFTALLMSCVYGILRCIRYYIHRRT